MKNFVHSLLIIILLSFFSCSKNTVFLHDFENNKWNINDSIEFVMNIENIDVNYDLIILFRNHIDYQYQNIYILVETYYGDSILAIDTLQYAITDKYGRWHGKGLGNTRDNKFLFEERKVFQQKGQYRFKIIHGMRENPLLSSDKIGLKIRQYE